jgi:hypothetical protein
MVGGFLLIFYKVGRFGDDIIFEKKRKSAIRIA